MNDNATWQPHPILAGWNEQDLRHLHRLSTDQLRWLALQATGCFNTETENPWDAPEWPIGICHAIRSTVTGDLWAFSRMRTTRGATGFTPIHRITAGYNGAGPLDLLDMWSWKTGKHVTVTVHISGRITPEVFVASPNIPRRDACHENIERAAYIFLCRNPAWHLTTPAP